MLYLIIYIIYFILYIMSQVHVSGPHTSCSLWWFLCFIYHIRGRAQITGHMRMSPKNLFYEKVSKGGDPLPTGISPKAIFSISNLSMFHPQFRPETSSNIRASRHVLPLGKGWNLLWQEFHGMIWPVLKHGYVEDKGFSQDIDYWWQYWFFIYLFMVILISGLETTTQKLGFAELRHKWRWW